MKKKMLSILSALCLVCCFSLVLSGCANKSLSINQIEEVLLNLTVVNAEGNEKIIKSYTNSTTSYSSAMLEWNRLFENANIDADNLRSVEKYVINEGRPSVEVIIIAFKFKDSESAKNCYNDYDFGIEYNKQLYGKVFVIAKTEYANQVFTAIGKI